MSETNLIPSTPIVGAHFRPPAKQVLALLAPNHKLSFEREPDNKHDPFAVKVLIDLTDEPDEFWDLLEPHLSGAGVERDEVEVEDFFCGFVDSSKTGNAKSMCEAMEAGQEPSGEYYVGWIETKKGQQEAPFARITWEQAPVFEDPASWSED